MPNLSKIANLKKYGNGDAYSGQYLATLEGLSSLQSDSDKQYWNYPTNIIDNKDFSEGNSFVPHYSTLKDSRFKNTAYDFLNIKHAERPQFFTDDVGNTIIIGYYDNTSPRFNGGPNIFAQMFNEGLLTLGDPNKVYLDKNKLSTIAKFPAGHGSSADIDDYNFFINNWSNNNHGTPFNFFKLIKDRENQGKVNYPYLYYFYETEAPSLASEFAKVAPLVIGALGIVTAGIGSAIFSQCYEIFSKVAMNYAQNGSLGVQDLVCVCVGLLPTVLTAIVPETSKKITDFISSSANKIPSVAELMTGNLGLTQTQANQLNTCFLSGARMFAGRGIHEVAALSSELGIPLSASDSNKFYNALLNHDLDAMAQVTGLSTLTTSYYSKSYKDNKLYFDVLTSSTAFEAAIENTKFTSGSMFDIIHLSQHCINMIQTDVDANGKKLTNMASNTPGAATIVKSLLWNLPPELNFTPLTHRTLIESITGRIPYQTEIDNVGYLAIFHQAQSAVDNGRAYYMPTSIPADKQLLIEAKLIKDLPGINIKYVSDNSTSKSTTPITSFNDIITSITNSFNNPSPAWL